MKYNWQNEVALITGATSGLGKALALRAAELHSTVILIARNLERLNKVAEEIRTKGGNPYIFQFDLTMADEVDDLYKKIIDTVPNPPTILINNAGYNAAGFIQNTPIKVYENNYKVNTLAAIAFTQCVLPDMIRENRGAIVNIMSAAMYHSFPGMSSYYSSKFALQAIHESLKAEVYGHQIKTVYVDPGGFLSNYWKNMKKGTRLKNFKYPEHKTGRDPAEIAVKILDAIEHGRENINLGGFKDRIGYHLNYWAPKIVDKLIINGSNKLLANRPDV